MTEIIAHRGTPRESPENSIPGYLKAIAQGANGIELDVHITNDGALVIHHDPTIHGRLIREMTDSEVKAYPLAEGVPVPRLPEVLAAVAGHATMYVEIKAAGIETEVVAAIREAHATAWCAIHSFDHRVARRVATLAPEIPTGILLDSYLVDPAHALRVAHARDYWQQWSFIDDALVHAVHVAGGRVIAWTVNTIEAGRSLTALGVDGLCTDVTKMFRESH